MKINFDTLENKNLLVFSLIGVVAIFLIANLTNQEEFPILEDWYMTDLLFILVPAIVIVLGSILIVRYGLRGNYGIAWILFTLAFCSWYVGELTYSYDYEYDIEDISTLTSDIFYILAYPLFLGFTIFYLKPRKRIISKNLILLSSLASLLFLIPSLYMTFDMEYTELDTLTTFLYVIYPILDVIILIPSIIATVLFFRGQVNLLWMMILLGIVLDVIADIGYLSFSIEESYYPGHPIDILYVASYVMIAFGALSHIRLYKKRKLDLKSKFD